MEFIERWYLEDWIPTFDMVILSNEVPARTFKGNLTVATGDEAS